MMWSAYTMPGVVPFVALTLVAGLVMAPLRALNGDRQRLSHDWSGISLAAVIVAGAAALIAFAGSEDGYFFPEPKTYWEFGGVGGRVVVPVAVTIASVAFLLIVVSLLMPSRSRALRALSSGVAFLACGALLAGFFAIGVGH